MVAQQESKWIRAFVRDVKTKGPKQLGTFVTIIQQLQNHVKRDFTIENRHWVLGHIIESCLVYLFVRKSINY